MKVYKILTLFLVLSLLGCDPTEMTSRPGESEVLLPLINADFTISDITLNEDLRLKEDSTGALSIVYTSQSDIHTSGIDNFSFFKEEAMGGG